MVWVEPGGDPYEIAESVQVRRLTFEGLRAARLSKEGGITAQRIRSKAAKVPVEDSSGGGGRRRPTPIAAAIAAACPPQAEGEVGGEAIIGVIAAIAVA